MLMSLAIVDDIGAILLIAIFYSTDISWLALGLAAAGLGVTYGLNRIGVRQVSAYVVLGAGVWLAVLKSGIHPTVAGVVLGFMTPATAWVGSAGFPNVLTKILERLVKGSDDSSSRQRHRALSQLSATALEGTSPLERLEFGLHPWVAFLIMPLFALANAGLSLEVDSLASPVALAVVAGLALGKPIGIVLFGWIATKLGVASLPREVNWMVMLGGGCLAGIGFTMSIFIGSVALEGDVLNDAKSGTLAGSAISAILGCVLLLMFMSKVSKATPGADEEQLATKRQSDDLLQCTSAAAGYRRSPCGTA
jgi:NhaA family Na+:H+ antiporter